MEGEKNSNIFLNLEKGCAIQSKMCLLEIKGKEIEDQEKIMQNLYQFFENLFSSNVPVSNKSKSNYLKY